MNKLQSVHMPNTFLNIGEENFGKYLTIHQIRQFFLCQNFPMYGTWEIIIQLLQLLPSYMALTRRVFTESLNDNYSSLA